MLETLVTRSSNKPTCSLELYCLEVDVEAGAIFHYLANASKVSLCRPFLLFGLEQRDAITHALSAGFVSDSAGFIHST